MFHHVANELAGEAGEQSFRYGGEAANVGEQHGDLTLAALEQGRVAVERGDQVGREELLELDPPARRLRFAFDPRQSGRHGRGQHLGQLGLERTDLGRAPCAPPRAVDRPDHLLSLVEDRRGDHGRHPCQAGRRRLDALVKGPALASDGLQDRPAELILRIVFRRENRPG